MPFAKYTANRAASVEPSDDAMPAPDKLARQLADEPDLACRAQLLDALIAQASAATVAALTGLFHHADPAVRAAGGEGLRLVDPALLRPALAKLLDDPASDIRIRALDVIERTPDVQTETMLIALLEREPVDNVCGVVLDLLAEIGTSAAVPAIRAARLRFANAPFIAFAANLALTQIGED